MKQGEAGARAVRRRMQEELGDWRVARHGSARAPHVAVPLPLDLRDLLDAGYGRLLGRVPDEGGRAHFCARLEAGEISALDFLLALRDSPEGLAYAAELPGLEAARRVQRLARVPLLGRWLARQAWPAVQPLFRTLGFPDVSFASACDRLRAGPHP